MKEQRQRHLALSLAHSRCSINNSCIISGLGSHARKIGTSILQGSHLVGPGIRLARHREANSSRCYWVEGMNCPKQRAAPSAQDSRMWAQHGAPSVFLRPWLCVSQATALNLRETVRRPLGPGGPAALAMALREKGVGARREPVKNVNGVMRSGSSRLALPGAGKSPEKEPQAPGAFCPRAWLCKSWGKGQEFRELVHSRSPRCQQVRDGGGSRGLQRPGRFRNENLQLSMQRTANRFFGFQSLRLWNFRPARLQTQTPKSFFPQNPTFQSASPALLTRLLDFLRFFVCFYYSIPLRLLGVHSFPKAPYSSMR